MVFRFLLLLALATGVLGCGSEAYFASDDYHCAQVRTVAASYLGKRFHVSFAPEAIAVTRAGPKEPFAFRAPFTLSDESSGVVAGRVYWNGFVYEVDDRVSIH